MSRTLLEPGEPLFKEPLAPPRHDLPTGIQACSNLIVAASLSSEEDGLGSYHISIRQRIATRLSLKQSAFLGSQLDRIGAFSRHRSFLPYGRVYRTGAKSYVLVFMLAGTKQQILGEG